MLDICKNNKIYEVIKQKDNVIYLFDHYKNTELMLEEEKLNVNSYCFSIDWISVIIRSPCS